MASTKMRKIAVANEKGGVGKTATIVNLGAALTLRGHNVLIVDMDPQFNATQGLGITLADVSHSVYDLINGEEAVSPADVVMETGWKGLSCLPSVPDLAGAEVELVGVEGRENRLRQGLAGIDGRFDYILLDTPPSLSLLTVNVFAYAEEVLVPCQTQPYAFNALSELVSSAGASTESLEPQAWWRPFTTSAPGSATIPWND